MREELSEMKSILKTQGLKRSDRNTDSNENFTASTKRIQRDWESLVGSNCVLNPVHIVADLGVHTRIVWQGTAIAPGDNALQLSIADHRATRVTLEGRNIVLKEEAQGKGTTLL